MADGLPTLTIWQPWASLIVLGVKTIETRSWTAPEHLIGQRIGIHAAARPPEVGLRLGLQTDIVFEEWLTQKRPGPTYHLLDLCNEESYPLPLGALVATARLDACVPMDDDPERNDRYLMITRLPELILYEAGWWNIPPDEDVGASTDITDQLPYGDFTPGRWAWLLSDIAPTTERCPWCDGRGRVEFTPVPPAMGGNRPCHLCGGAGRCDPIPAKGHQRVWYWTPEDLPPGPRQPTGNCVVTGPGSGGTPPEAP